MRMLAALLALLMPAGQVLAAMHLHCALEHSPGRATAHASGDADHWHAGGADLLDRGNRAPADEHGGVHSGDADGHDHVSHDVGEAAPGTPDARGVAADGTLFEEHHHHHNDGATSAHGCCVGGSAGAVLCDFNAPGPDVRIERFDLPVPSAAYDSPVHEPPPRPQWRSHAPA